MSDSTGVEGLPEDPLFPQVRPLFRGGSENLLKLGTPGGPSRSSPREPHLLDG